MFLCQACQVLMKSQRKPCHTDQISPPTMIPNPCRHPAYHILPNTLLVYQFIYIKDQEHQFRYIVCVYKVNGEQFDQKDPRPGGHSLHHLYVLITSPNLQKYQDLYKQIILISLTKFVTQNFRRNYDHFQKNRF